MSNPIDVMPMHISVIVSNINRSLAFYTQAFGFTVGFEREYNGEAGPVLMLPGTTKFREVFLVRDHMLLMLMGFEIPQPLAAHEHAANRVGISRIAFGVPDIDEAASRVAAHGGKVLAHTRESLPEAEMLVVTDPDGLHIALVRRNG